MMTYAPVDERLVDVQANTSQRLRGYAREKVLAALAHTPRPVTGVRVRLILAAAPAPPAAYARVNVDLDGRLVRAEARAATMTEAIDLLHDRLCRRLETVKGSLSHTARPGVPAQAGARDPLVPAGPPPVARPDARIVPVDAPLPTGLDLIAAAAELDLLDFRFLLFHDAEADVDSLITRAADAYRLYRVRPGVPPRTALHVMLSPHPAPLLSVEQAVERLRLTAEPYLFFAQPETGRGAVAYVRFDGDLGLITAHS